MTLIAEYALDYFSEWSSDLALPEQIPAMQRRRLSTIAKKALTVACQSLAQARSAGVTVDYLLWVSRFGDESKTLNILKEIDAGEVPSPTAFSTSVHNAIAGLYSILLEDDMPSSSLSAGEETLSEGMLESMALLQSGQARHVLLVCYDEVLPELYQATFEATASYQPEAVALAMVVSLQQPNLQLWLADSIQPIHSQEALVFKAFWRSEQQQMQHGRYVWKKP